MVKFEREVDLEDRKAMAKFLTGHFRYWTMNSWNRSRSFANDVKLTHLGLDNELTMKAMDMLEFEETVHAMECVFDVFFETHDHDYTIGFNGRSSGYLVLYRSALDRKTGFTAVCDACGRRSYHKQDTPCTNSTCSGTLRALAQPIPRKVPYPGQGVFEGHDFSDPEMDMEFLQEVSKLVMDFDRACDDTVAAFLDVVRTHDIVSETILVPKTVRTLREREPEDVKQDNVV